MISEPVKVASNATDANTTARLSSDGRAVFLC